MPEIGIIGGSGIYDPELIKQAEEKKVATPFGDPSSSPIIGEIKGKEVAFIARHGKEHIYNPTEVNYRANIYALKKLGVNRILATNAVGSLKKEIEPTDIVIPDQIFDRTKKRESTFFEDGAVAHVGFADPYCNQLRKLINNEIGDSNSFSLKEEGTYVCIEGPMFSTKAESDFYRKQGFDVIGMTAIPEAKLAREAEICYTMIAAITDYDVWHTEEEVSMELILQRMQKNEKTIKRILEKVIPQIPEERKCECKKALEGSITTEPANMSDEVKEKLSILLKDYI
ncbi:MAG: Purine nucleoside phosphorylase Pnp [Candidatus Methanohalarchaeum thermophilum]|uniref:S-methyl-5'-thioadenosine phosphorylase n=1 Tax=Methanohalarchaeum thermophilum TaxID=1903181 RepID=A0A1Q6DXS8_METT1|nr:MAG: Purine nucleoside phosphorylase Pnp [Candidatus Methanohalarchaeum thermophilum]